MTLPFDIDRCITATCPLASRCLRYLDPGRPDYQAFTEFPGGEDCDGFISTEADNA